MENEYERLRAQGYTEEEINMELDGNISQISLNDAPMGQGRQDKSAYITDSQGHSMKTSNVMMGYNKKGLNLPSGVYVSAEELDAAMTDFLTTDAENKIIVCKSTGKRVDVSTLTTTIIEALVAGPGLTIVGSSNKITNQTTYQYGIRGEAEQKRVFMAGNKGFQMPNGEYVKIDELQAALHDYVYMQDQKVVPVPIIPEPIVPDPITPEPIVPDPVTPEPIVPDPVTPEPIVPDPVTPEPIPSKKPTKPIPESKTDSVLTIPGERHRVVQRKKWPNWRALALAVGTAIILFVGSLGLDQRMVEKTIMEMHQNANYEITQMSETQIYESIEESVERAISEHSTGDKVYIEDGVRYDHESDQVTDIHGVIGSGLREEGEYNLDYVSILNEEGKIIKVETEQGVNLGETINEALEENGLDFEDVQVRVHIGGPVSGWIDAEDILTAEELTPQLIEEKFVVENVYEGAVENFDGTVTLATENGATTLDVVDENGNVKEGATIVGSDGETYRIDNLDVNTITTETTHVEAGDKYLTHSLENLKNNAVPVAIAETILASGILASSLLQKKKEEEVEKEFEESNYSSKFDDTLQRLSNKEKENYSSQNIDEETSKSPTGARL